MKQASPPPSPEDNTTARMQVYRLLSTAFRYPTDDFFESLIGGKYRIALSEALAMSPYHDSLFEKELLEEMEEIEALLAQMNFEDYQVLFTETFEVGAPKPPCPPYEGFQRKSLPRNAAMLQITAFYKHFGLEMDQQEGKRELPDHISAELEFMHFLIFKESQARETGDKELLTGYLLAQHDFLQRHLLKWVPAFAEKIEEIRPETALALFAEITARILQEEAGLVRDYLKELGVDAKLPEVDVEKEKPVASVPDDESDTSADGCSGCGVECY